MPRLVPLPPRIHGRAFVLGDPIRADLTDARLRGRDVQQPFHGVRSVGVDTSTVIGRCRAFAPRMRPSHFFSHSTAALLHGIPLPLDLQLALELHVANHAPGSRVRTRGVTSHRLSSRVRVTSVDGLRTADPVSTWCDLSPMLTVDELIAAGDYLISGRVTDSGRLPPLATRDELVLATQLRRGERGSKLREQALPYLRERVDSPRESKLRMLLVRSGLPEPIVNETTYDSAGTELGTPDLKYRRPKVVFEYEGDEHRRDIRRFRRDIVRRERFEDAGWRVRRVVADDLDLHPGKFVRDVHALLLRRGMELPDLGPAAASAASGARHARR